MKNQSLINQSIPDEFSSNYINYKVEYNPNIHYNYNPAEITAMREEKLREEAENEKRKKISECITKCKQNIIKYNQEKQNESEKINESISSIQRGKEYNENLRRQMKMKAERKRNKKMNNKENTETDYQLNNYEEEVIPTFSFKEPPQTNEDNVDLDGNVYNDFYNNNKINNNVKDISQNIESQIHDNSYNTSPFINRTLASNLYIRNSNYENNNNLNNGINPTNLFDNNSYNNNNLNISQNKQNRDINIQQQINNNIQIIQKFRQTGSLLNNTTTNDFTINNQNYINNNYSQNIPQPQPLIIAGKIPPKSNNINELFNNQNQAQDLNINDISSIKSGNNYSTHLHTNSNYTMNESNIQQSNNKNKNNSKNKKNIYKSPYEMNELQQKRYKNALRKLVLERFNSKKIDIPSICSCGQLQRKIDSFLNDNKLITQNDLMNVDCANNCIYYQKPGNYHRALTDIIQSIRTLQLENGIRK